MDNPQLSQVHVEGALPDLVVGALNSDSNFVAGRVFSLTPVNNTSDKFFKWTQADLLRDDAVMTAGGTGLPDTNVGLTVDTFSTDEYTVGHKLPIRTLQNSDDVLKIEQAIASILVGKIQQKMEGIFTAQGFTTGIWGTDASLSSAQWSDNANDPRAAVDVGKAKILRETGREPNQLTIGYEVYQALQRNAFVRDQIKYTSAATPDDNALAGFFGMKQVIVGKATRNTAVRGATPSYSLYAGKNALLTYNATLDNQGNTPFTPEAAKMFVFNKRTNGIVSIESGVNTELGYYWWKAQIDASLKVCTPSMGYLMTSAVA